jgi:hypothetical protein
VLESAGFAADDAESVDGAHDDDEVLHDFSGVVTQHAVVERAELHFQRLVHSPALQLLRRRPNARGRHLQLRQKLLGVLERFPLQPVEQVLPRSRGHAVSVTHAHNNEAVHAGEQHVLQHGALYQTVLALEV